MTRTDLKPGDIVQHPEKGRGLVHRRFARNDVGVVYADKDRDGITSYTYDLDGWERVETCTRSERQWLDYRGGVRCTCDHNPATTNGPEEDCEIHGRPYAEWVKRAAGAQAESARIETVRPGHVQVRVDDLGKDLSDWLNEDEDSWELSGRVAIRAAKALAAQRTENTPPADAEEADFAIGWLNCPWCSESFTIAPRLARDAGGHVRNVGLSIVHTCLPAQPDEPTEFGAKVTVNGGRWLRVEEGKSDWPWQNGYGDNLTWNELTQRGTVTIGWEE